MSDKQSSKDRGPGLDFTNAVIAVVMLCIILFSPPFCTDTTIVRKCKGQIVGSLYHETKTGKLLYRDLGGTKTIAPGATVEEVCPR